MNLVPGGVYKNRDSIKYVVVCGIALLNKTMFIAVQEEGYYSASHIDDAYVYFSDGRFYYDDEADADLIEFVGMAHQRVSNTKDGWMIKSQAQEAFIEMLLARIASAKNVLEKAVYSDDARLNALAELTLD